MGMQLLAGCAWRAADSLKKPGQLRDKAHKIRQPGPPFQDLASGCKQPKSDNKPLVLGWPIDS